MIKLQFESVKEGLTMVVTNIVRPQNLSMPKYFKLTKMKVEGEKEAEVFDDSLLKRLEGKLIRRYVDKYPNNSYYKIEEYDLERKELKLKLVGREMMPIYTMGSAPPQLYFADSDDERELRYYYSVDEDNLATPIELITPTSRSKFNEETKTIDMSIVTEYIGRPLVLYKNGYYFGTRILKKYGINEQGIGYIEYDKFDEKEINNEETKG